MKSLEVNDLEVGAGKIDEPELATAPSKSRIGVFGWIIVNTIATVGIVFINKKIFDNPAFIGLPIAFTCFHFICTTLTLTFMQTRVIGAFTPKRLPIATILPLCWAFIGNVTLPNLCLVC